MNLWEHKNGDRVERDWIMDMECMESKPPHVSIEDLLLLAVLTKIELY